jgi:hypothetical protein
MSQHQGHSQGRQPQGSDRRGSAHQPPGNANYRDHRDSSPGSQNGYYSGRGDLSSQSNSQGSYHGRQSSYPYSAGPATTFNNTQGHNASNSKSTYGTSSAGEASGHNSNSGLNPNAISFEPSGGIVRGGPGTHGPSPSLPAPRAQTRNQPYSVRHQPPNQGLSSLGFRDIAANASPTNPPAPHFNNIDERETADCQGRGSGAEERDDEDVR